MTQHLHITSYGSGAGVLVCANGDSLDSLGKDNILHQLAETGYILLRNFNIGIDSFSRFVQKLSVRVTLDPARSFNDKGDVAQKVDAGHAALGLHCENGNSPFIPHLCWFFCEKAASQGSQTTVCDGYRVWDGLSAGTRAAFAAQDIVYHRNVEEDKWKRFVFHMLRASKPLAEISLADLLALANDPAHTTITPGANGAIHYAFRTPAAHSTLFGTRLAFANSILGPSYHYEAPVITFADGTPLPEQMLEEIAEVSASVTDDIDWRHGDVALIDNTRVMHGRRAISDPNRTIYNALSFIH